MLFDFESSAKPEKPANVWHFMRHLHHLKMSKEQEDVIKAVRALYKEMFLNH